MTQIKIKLSDKYRKKLGIGHTAKKIFEEANKHDKVILDFENIEFMSRSFAQEYVYQKNTSKSEITEINMVESIEKLLQLADREYDEFITS